MSREANNYSQSSIEHDWVVLNTTIYRSRLSHRFTDVYGNSTSVANIDFSTGGNCYGYSLMYLILALCGKEDLYFKFMEELTKDSAKVRLRNFSLESSKSSEKIDILPYLFFLHTVGQLQSMQTIRGQEDYKRFNDLKRKRNISFGLCAVLFFFWLLFDVALNNFNKIPKKLVWINTHILDYVFASSFVFLFTISLILYDNVLFFKNENELLLESNNQNAEKILAHMQKKRRLTFGIAFVFTWVLIALNSVLTNVSTMPKQINWLENKVLNYTLGGAIVLLLIIEFILTCKTMFFVIEDEEQQEKLAYYTVICTAKISPSLGIDPGHAMAAKFDKSKSDKPWTLFDCNLDQNRKNFASKKEIIEYIKEKYTRNDKDIVFRRYKLSEQVQKKIQENINDTEINNSQYRIQKLLYSFFDTPDKDADNQQVIKNIKNQSYIKL